MALRNKDLTLFYLGHHAIEELLAHTEATIKAEEKSSSLVHYKELNAELQKYKSKGFSEDRVTDLLDKILREDKGESGERYRKLLDVLSHISSNHTLTQSEVNQTIKQLLHTFTHTTFTDHGIELKEGDIEICISGSLSRGHATPYSDIDCFIIIADHIDELTKQNVKKIANHLVSIAYKIAFNTNQFIFDPVLLNPSKLCGTVEELFAKLKEFQDEIQLDGVMNAKSLGGSKALLDRLHVLTYAYFHQNVVKITNGRSKTHAEYYFHESKSYKMSEKDEVINIKKHLIRPIQYVLQGLSVDAKIKLNEFEQSDLLKLLVEKKKIDEHTMVIIGEVLNKSYELRKRLHIENRQEADEVKVVTKEIGKMLKHVELIHRSLAFYHESPMLSIKHAKKLEKMEQRTKKSSKAVAASGLFGSINRKGWLLLSLALGATIIATQSNKNRGSGH